VVTRVATGAEVTPEIQLLGAFSVRHGGHLVPLPTAASRLVALLAIYDRALRRSFAASVLHPDATDAAAQARLRTTIWRLGNRAPGLITATASHISLAAGVGADIRDVRTLLVALLYGESTCDNNAPSLTPTGSLGLSHTLSLELLPGWDESWVITERLRLRQLCLHGLEYLAAAFLNVGAADQALVLARVATELAPLRESAHAVFIRALLAAGDALGAVGAYSRFCDALAKEWALDPPPWLRTFTLCTRCSR
jgi:DNA-binding SARP family transcriptional activator